MSEKRLAFRAFITRFALPLAAVLGFCPAFHGLAHAEMAAGPSFSCRMPTRVEAVICADPDLSTRDRTMAALFAAARKSVLEPGASAELEKQRNWLSERDKSCSDPAAIRSCLAETYNDRLYDLAVATLFTAHDEAIAELRRQNSEGADIEEAVYQYATIEQPDLRRRTVVKLIQSAFDALRVHPEQDIGGIHAPAQAEAMFQDIPDATTAASSDDNFSTFLVVASVWGYGGPSRDLEFPCAAVTRRPGLIAAMGSHYGGAVDGHVPSFDCEATLPPTPDFDRLVSAAERTQPTCQGTVRFSLGADYEKLLMQIRLHLLDRTQRHQLSSMSENFQRANAALIAASQSELKTYYAEVFDLSPIRAEKDGKLAVDAAVRGAFDLCE